MKNNDYILAIDQGTTNSRAIIFNQEGLVQSQHEIPLKQFFPKPGWVEQDPEEMFEKTIECCKKAIEKAHLHASTIKAIGISNQRETTIIWDKKTGKVIYPAIVWQDRRTSQICQTIKNHELHQYICNSTGLLIDPYFSATKIIWILENVPEARKKALANELLFGTVDTYLIWRMSRGQSHVTDASNASRTLLFNIHTQDWDQSILNALAIPENILPEVLDSSANFGVIDENILGAEIPITGVAGDQQAASIGQACFHPGMIKATYGTGAFLFLNTGEKIVHSQNKLLTTVAYRLKNKVSYALEGSIFSAGETVKWLRDNLKLFTDVKETEFIAKKLQDNGGVYLIPAFTGLGAPYWNPDIRAAIMNIERNITRDHIVRAALESVAYQTQDLLLAMMKDQIPNINILRVDGGMMTNQWLIQFLADIIQKPIERSQCIETSALGVSFLAGLQVGVYQSLEHISSLWKLDLSIKPEMSMNKRNCLYQGWKNTLSKIQLT